MWPIRAQPGDLVKMVQPIHTYIHTYSGWQLYGVHSVHSDESGKPGKGHRVEGHVARRAQRTQLRVQGQRTENSKH